MKKVCDAALSFPDAALSFPDAALSFPDAVPFFPDATPFFPDAALSFPDASLSFPDAVPFFPDAVPFFPDAAPFFPGAAPFFPDRAASETFSPVYFWPAAKLETNLWRKNNMYDFIFEQPCWMEVLNSLFGSVFMKKTNVCWIFVRKGSLLENVDMS